MATATIERPLTQTETDLMAVLGALRRLGCDMRPSEVAQYSGLSEERVRSALWLAERRGLVRVAFWRLTDEGREA